MRKICSDNRDHLSRVVEQLPLKFLGNVVPLHNNRSSETAQNMLLFRRERVAFKPIFVRCVHHLVDIMLQPFFVVSQHSVAAFQVPKFADFVGRLRVCRQLQIFGSFCAILLGAEHMVPPPVSWPLCDGYLLMSICKRCVKRASGLQSIRVLGGQGCGAGSAPRLPVAACASRRKNDATISAQGRLSYLSSADFGAINSVKHASTSAELGYDSPGRVTISLGNSFRRFHDSTFESATCFASASGIARNLSAHTGASAATTASSERSFAILSAVLPSDQPPQ